MKRFHQPKEEEPPKTPPKRQIGYATDPPRYYCGKHLDEWRKLVEKAVDEKNMAIVEDELAKVGGYSTHLTEMLVRDWSEHTGFPEHIEGKSIDTNGFIHLCGAVLKTGTTPIIAYSAILLNHERYADGIKCGRKYPAEALKTIRTTAESSEHWLLSKQAELYTLGLPGDAIIRRAKSEAKEKLLYHYRTCKKCSAAIAIDNIVEMVGRLDNAPEFFESRLGLNEDGLREWLAHPTTERRMKLYLAIKEEEE